MYRLASYFILYFRDVVCRPFMSVIGISVVVVVSLSFLLHSASFILHSCFVVRFVVRFVFFFFHVFFSFLNAYSVLFRNCARGMQTKRISVCVFVSCIGSFDRPLFFDIYFQHICTVLVAMQNGEREEKKSSREEIKFFCLFRLKCVVFLALQLCQR